jgi:transposase-like protein
MPIYTLAEKALTAVIQQACVPGIARRSVDELIKALGMADISRSQISGLGAEIDRSISRCGPSSSAPSKGDFPIWTPPFTGCLAEFGRDRCWSASVRWRAG